MELTDANNESSNSQTIEVTNNLKDIETNVSESKNDTLDINNKNLENITDNTVVETQNTKESNNTNDNPLSLLTKRELEVADLISFGYSNGNIAKMLFISEYTVKDHTKNIYRKLDVHSRFELAALVNKIKANETN